MDEYRIRLPVYVSQFDTLIRDRLQCFAAKKERRRINMLQYPPFLFFHDRCQLLQITDHQQLYPAERFAPVSVAAEHITHRIQQICPDHTDLIDDQQIHAPDNIDFFPSEFMVKPFLTRAVFFGSTRNIRSERQLKK